MISTTEEIFNLDQIVHNFVFVNFPYGIQLSLQICFLEILQQQINYIFLNIIFGVFVNKLITSPSIN